ncbi:TlpA disulfide reductase family protein [Pedobacter hiemivivus]|uniref:AhpC/TSA family protein n=1 Tax=Pedobacter hiemivivus TaxID=2530454 RepID=A0A4R0NDJ5_9SPHI|nr:TlpA disulfide reductase family protein [Pedobacter hiemivivus]TCC98459.1 AhpC/TSA family protein [Pedobacter hiemivivus]
MKSISIIIALIFPFLGVAQTNNPNVMEASEFEIRGVVKSLKDNTKLFIVYNSNKTEKVDSVYVKNGLFSIKGRVDKPSLAYIFNGFYPGSTHKPTSDYKRIYLGSGVINLSSLSGLKYSVINGTKANRDIQLYDDMMLSLVKKREALQYQFYKDIDGKSKSEKEQITEAYNNNTDKIRTKELSIKYDYIKKVPNSVLSQAMIPEMLMRSENLVLFDSLYNAMSPSVQKSEMGRYFFSTLQIKHKTTYGKKALDFTQNDLNGNPVNFEQFRKGKYVLLDFWASWCVPCRQENPNVVKAYHKYRNYNFDILGVALENGESGRIAWKKAIAQDELPWTQVSDFKYWNNEAAVLYNVLSVPSNYLIDPNGIIIAKNLRGEELERFLRDRLITIP